jgi:hypothetical protein
MGVPSVVLVGENGGGFAEPESPVSSQSIACHGHAGSAEWYGLQFRDGTTALPVLT